VLGDSVLNKRWIVGGFSLAAVLAAGYYLASPFLALNSLKNSFANKDADKVNQYIDYPALREDLKGQLMAAAIKNMQSDPEMSSNPFSGFAAAMVGPMVNAMVDSYVTPSGMKTVMALSSGEQASQDETSQNLAERAKDLNEALKKTSFGYEGLDKFGVTATGDDGAKTKLMFARSGFADWKLKGVVLPQ
jgi:hypothetical protein